MNCGCGQTPCKTYGNKKNNNNMKMMNNPFKGSDNVGGLYVEDGRLINGRMDGETGIAQAARIKRAIKNDRKINRIAEGIELADNKKNWRELEF
ncbi:MAG: hypothetical protein Unbinned6224contig1000_70 [Prokaryotic dsDNA virus sp.]|nr:MAG: hypothetical protein Unbinned6224contig1000_70 [Prokaryotic dsDNA virus sp.]|tara:strand:- start:53047 stop:53328 length:282 start_codon:yes stop_codon:yes gene_type:complete